VPEKKSAKSVRKSYSLQIGQTWEIPTGNQTITSVVDPLSRRAYGVILIWEAQGQSQQIASPFQIRVQAGPANPFDASQTNRMLNNEGTQENYPISSTLMRRIPYERIIDDSRRVLIEANKFSVENEIPLIHPLVTDQLNKPTNKGRTFDRNDGFYREIAKRYLEASAIGGSVARKPASYIAQFVKKDVNHLEPPAQYMQIRKWVAEARKRGYIPPIKKEDKK
jgi:hypothetical protein